MVQLTFPARFAIGKHKPKKLKIQFVPASQSETGCDEPCRKLS